MTSGGLGPTADDLTADVVAEWVGAEMRHDAELEERIWAVVSRLRRRMPFEEEAMRAGARKQALVPVGAAVLEPVGTAPGLLVGASPLVAVLPGPPRELQTMWEAAVETSPLRELLASAGTLEQRILRFFPLPEPQIAATLREIDADSLPLEVTTCLRRGELEVATVFAPSDAAAYASLEAALRERHGSVLFSDDGATIDEVVARLLDGRTIATAESCTGGLMAGRLTDLAGSSAYVLGGLVVYSNEAKTALAGVPASLIAAHGAVSPEVATALSRGARERLGADFGIGITGIAGRAAARRRSPSAPCASRSAARSTPRNGPCTCRAGAPTSATARPPSRSTCSGRCCCAHESGPAAASRRSAHFGHFPGSPARDQAAARAPRRRARPRPRAAAPPAHPRPRAAPRRRARPRPRPHGAAPAHAASARSACSSRSTSRRRRAMRSPRSAPPRTPTCGAPSSPRRCTSRSPSSARARPGTWRRSSP